MAASWSDGDYCTGDTAWRDEDGYIWFVGRDDDVIKSSGYRIGPFEVESALMEHPAVLECAVTAFPDPVRGEAVKATIVLVKDAGYTPGQELIKMLQDHVKRVTAPYKYPRVIEFVDSLPKTTSGKIRRQVIRAMDLEKLKQSSWKLNLVGCRPQPIFVHGKHGKRRKFSCLFVHFVVQKEFLH